MRSGSRHKLAYPGRPNHDSAGPARAVHLDELQRLAEPVTRAAGMELESVHLTSVGRRRLLRVVVDACGGVGVDDMADVSHRLSATLDAAGIMGEAPYTLEVTSPGVDRPLTEPRHWQRAVGRMVRAAVAARPHAGNGEVAAGQAIHGRIIAVSDDGVVLDIGGVRRQFGFGELGPGKVQLEFRRDDLGESGGH